MTCPDPTTPHLLVYTPCGVYPSNGLGITLHQRDASAIAEAGPETLQAA